MGNHVVLAVWDTISVAWAKLDGAKTTIWAALLVLFLITFGFALLRIIAEHIPSVSSSMALVGITGIIGQAIQWLMQCGLYYLGVRRGADLPITYDMMFATFTWHFFWRIALLFFLVALIAYLPALIIGGLAYYLSNLLMMNSIFVVGCIIAGIWFFYLGIRLSLCIGFALEGVSAWTAIKSSWHATKDNVLSLVGIFILTTMIVIISIIPLGIGLIWTLPWAFVLYGVIYNRLKANVAVITTPSP